MNYKRVKLASLKNIILVAITYNFEQKHSISLLSFGQYRLNMKIKFADNMIIEN